MIHFKKIRPGVYRFSYRGFLATVRNEATVRDVHAPYGEWSGHFHDGTETARAMGGNTRRQVVENIQRRIDTILSTKGKEDDHEAAR